MPKLFVHSIVCYETESWWYDYIFIRYPTSGGGSFFGDMGRFWDGTVDERHDEIDIAGSWFELWDEDTFEDVNSGGGRYLGRFALTPGEKQSATVGGRNKDWWYEVSYTFLFTEAETKAQAARLEKIRKEQERVRKRNEKRNKLTTGPNGRRYWAERKDANPDSWYEEYREKFTTFFSIWVELGYPEPTFVVNTESKEIHARWPTLETYKKHRIPLHDVPGNRPPRCSYLPKKHGQKADLSEVKLLLEAEPTKYDCCGHCFSWFDVR